MKIACRVVLILSLISCSAFADEEDQGVVQSPKQNPVKTVVPYMQKDKSTVIVFFKFGCPSCRLFHTSFVQWGKSLPKGLTFQMIPVVEPEGNEQISKSSIYGLQAFWVMDKIGTEDQQELFSYDAYSLVQDKRAGDDKLAWLGAVLNQGTNKSRVVDAWKSEIPLLNDRIARQLHYSPTVTPTMVICGKWSITLESTNGDQELFTKLANAMTSKCIIELGIAMPSR
jgi:protein dithiol oxidoreductase (disulfide-forming)